MNEPIVKRAPIIVIERTEARPAPRFSRQARVLLVWGIAALLMLNGYWLGGWAIAAFWGIGEAATRWYPDTNPEDVRYMRIGSRIVRLYGNTKKGH